MERRPRKICRWLIVLAETGLLLGLLVSAALASDMKTAMDVAVVDPALVADGHDSTLGLGGTDLYLDVTLNGAHAGLAHFRYVHGELWASRATLRRLSFALPTGIADPARLAALPDVQANYDAANQTLAITAPLSLLSLDTTVLNQPANRRPQPAVSPGMLLNYDVYGTQGPHASSLSAYTELRAFNGAGVLSSTALTQAAHDDGSRWQNRSVRLDTNWSASFPDSLLTVRIGDTLTSALSWSRATRIGGVQIGTNFALQPYLITAPLPSFIGSATLPSAVQLYVNGVRQYNGQVPAGPFELNTMPTISGAGNAQVVLTDALGRATTLNFSLYDEHQMLQQGLSDWSAELGVVRNNYGLRSFDYGHDPAGSGTWRYGVSNSFTAEAHAEATSGLTNAGAGGDWLLGDSGGVVSAALARSKNVGSGGALYSLGYSWRDSRFNFDISGTRTRGAYRDVATLYGAPAPSISAQALLGYNTDHLGAFGTSYLHLRYRGQDATRYASAYWFKSAGQAWMLNLSVNQNLDRADDRSIFLTATLSLDHNLTVSSGVQHDTNGTSLTLDASQSVPSQGGFGWRTSLHQGSDYNGGQGELDYLGRYGQLEAGVHAAGDDRYGYANATGALVLMGGGVFAARHIDDGFAVISTDGIAHVPVQLENNPIGTTDRRGLLLITPLNAYQNNQVSIDPMDLPPDVRISQVRTQATPGDRTGTLVRFDITPVRAASVILHDADGQPLPVGSSVTLVGQPGGNAMIGFDGAVYLDTLSKHNTVVVHTPVGSCRTSFDYHGERGNIPAIGPLVCRKDTSP
jgi:outer membrane usher protein